MIALLAVPSLVGYGPVRADLASAGLTRQDEAFVAVSFPNLAAVTEFTAATGATSVDFALTNGSGEALPVSWTATVVGDGSTRQVAAGELSLAAESSGDAAFAVDLSCATRQVVEVRATAPGVRAATVQFFVLPLRGPRQSDGQPFCTSNPAEAAS